MAKLSHIKDNLWVLGGNLFNAGFGFLSFMFLAHILSVDEFGVWLLYVAAFTFMEMVRAGFIYQALVKYFASHSKGLVQKVITGASWWIGIGATTVFSLVIALLGWAFAEPIAAKNFTLFFKWYPIIIWITLPSNMGLWISHSRQRYIRMVIIQMIITGGFGVFVLINYNQKLDLHTILVAHTAVRLVAGIFTLARGWDGIRYIRYVSKRYMQKLIQFGQYSLFSMLGTNLLKSTDVFLVGIFIGPAAVAIYQFPLKIIELAEVPLRSFATTAFPRIAKWTEEKKYMVANQFIQKQVLLFIMLATPCCLVGMIWSEFFMVLLGKAKYAASAPVFQILLIYVIFLPIDRFIGIALDSLNRPQINTLKIGIMVVINIIGDYIVLSMGGSLAMVAGVTLVNIAIGMGFGWYKIHKTLPIHNVSQLNIKQLLSLR